MSREFYALPGMKCQLKNWGDPGPCSHPCSYAHVVTDRVREEQLCGYANLAVPKQPRTNSTTNSASALFLEWAD